MLQTFLLLSILRCNLSFFNNFAVPLPQRNHVSVKLLQETTGFEVNSIFSEIFRMISFQKQPPKDAILVVGASGRLGAEVVKALVKSGRDVVAAGKDDKKLKELFSEYTKSKNFWMRSDCDVTSSELPKSLLDGVSQVVSCLGPSFQKPEYSATAVDYEGNLALISACQKVGMGQSNGSDLETLISSFDGGKSDTLKWVPLDDVIMGGQSSSSWQSQDTNSNYRSWSGILRVEGGGFCGSVVRNANFDVTGYDGIRLVVRGEGSRYKFRLKPAGMENEDEYQYQASFDTLNGAWTVVDIPFHAFTAVRRSRVIYNAPAVNKHPSGTKMSSIGIILSRFEYNNWPNPKYQAGPFQLDMKSISLYRSPRPSFVMISSAGAERYNRLSDEERRKDIPIIQLNPQGILNWKYKAECALRYSGIPYTVLRPTGLVNGDKEEAAKAVSFCQMDTISGKITRKEVAEVVAACLSSPYATNKTMEVTRTENTGEKNIQDGDSMSQSMRSLVKDSERAVRSQTPFPPALDPPAPPSAERVAEILNDPRVKAAQGRTE